MTYSRYSSIKIDQSFVLMNIEALVERIIQNPNAALNYIPFELWLSLYDPDRFDYSEQINAFWFGCHQAGLFESNVISYQTLQLDKFVQGILTYSSQDAFKRELSDQRYQTKANRERLELYIRSIQEKYARLLVLRIDFGYAKTKIGSLCISDVYEHLGSMKQLYYVNPLFKHLVASGWRIEQGKEKGYHIHAFYCFKGSEHQNDWYLAQEIGRLWKAITVDFDGGYHSCNTPENKAIYQRANRLGIGMIHRGDEVGCENMSLALGYLAKPEKDDQYLRMKPKGRRTFGRGLIHH